MASKKYDVVIIGGGPNGLLAGAYLAKTGLKVLIIEKRFEMGGGLATEEVTLSGFYHNVHATYMMMQEFAPAYKDLELETRYKLKHIYPELQFAMPTADGNTACIYSDVEKTCQNFAKFSTKDADSYRDLSKKFDTWVDDFLGPYTYVQPKATLELAASMEQLEMGQEMFELTDKSPCGLVEEWFENDKIRALMLNAVCFWGLDPEQSGLGYLIPLYFNRSSKYRICSGGSHTLAQAMIKSVLHNGGELLTVQTIKRIIVEDGVAKGIEMDDGRIYEAGVVLSTLDTHQTFFKYIGEGKLEKDFAEGLKLWQWEHWAFLGVHVALLAAPEFKFAVNNPEMGKALINILGCETVDDYLAHCHEIAKGEMNKMVIHATFPTLFDPTQAKVPGNHTAIIQQHVPYELADGGAEKWYSYSFKEELAAKMIDKLSEYAPNITDAVVRETYISTPIDYENKFLDMVKGSFKQGQYHPFQMGYMRPNEACSNHRSPIKRLYMGGSCTFPGGTILLANGYLAAEAICEDLGVNKWWRVPEFVQKARDKGIPI